MPDSLQEKTEAPTARRLHEARSRGQIGKSSDLTGALVLLTSLLLLHSSGRSILDRLVAVTRVCLGDADEPMADRGTMTLTFQRVFGEAAMIVLPMMLMVLVVALVCLFLQVGPLITFEPLKPSLSRLNPLNGLKRLFDAHAFVVLAMGIAKAAFLSLIAYWTLRGKFDVIIQLSGLHHVGIVAVIAELVYTLGIRMAIALLILAILDFIYQKYRTYNQLRMSKQEIQEEMKRMDGDPKVKQRRRQVQLQLSMQRLRSAVPKADVIVTNPTEYAVAIQYDSDAMAAPKVVAKGTDYLAQRIRQVAIEHGIPIVERPPLARALYREVEIGRQIPPHFYRAIAEILAYVYELAGRAHGRRTMNPAMN